MKPNKIGILADLNPGYRPHAVMNSCFEELQDAYGFTFDWIPTDSLTEDVESMLCDCTGIIAGSGPYKSKKGVINGIRYARLNNVPFLGTCSGFGYAVLEFAQHLFALPDVFHPYERPGLAASETFLQPLNNCPTEIIPIQFEAVGGTLAASIYGNGVITELSHCVYGINPDMLPAFTTAGFIPCCLDEANEAKVIEYNLNDFFIITLFLPQLKSSLNEPHPVIRRFLEIIAKKV